MKKIFAVALALMLVMSMGTSAFAAEYVGEAALDAADSSTSFDINGKIVDDNTDVSVIAVDVSYGAMRFVFSKDASGELWNPSTHKYDAGATNAEGGSWFAENGSNYVTITNHSNVAVGVKLGATTGIIFDPDGGTQEHEGKLIITITNVEYENNTSEYVPDEVDGDRSVATYSTDWYDVATAEGTEVVKAPYVKYLVDVGGSSYQDTFYNFDSTDWTVIGNVTVSIKEADLTI